MLTGVIGLGAGCVGGSGGEWTRHRGTHDVEEPPAGMVDCTRAKSPQSPVSPTTTRIRTFKVKIEKLKVFILELGISIPALPCGGQLQRSAAVMQLYS